MLTITLPDESQRSFDSPITVEQLATSISRNLGKIALAGVVDGVAVDTTYLINNDAHVLIVTSKDQLGLEVIRHSTSHLLAYAVKELFPSAQVTIGPVIENGFYYDFSFERPFTTDDLRAIEKKMAEISSKNEKVERRVLSRDDAVIFFKNIGERYKSELIESIPSGEEVSLYREGNFEDLCRGPHVPSTGFLKHFKLMKVAGAYWRGDAKNEMLQRIYGTAWASKDELDQYLHMLEQAEKRDHRKLGRELDLFHIDEYSPGTVFWHQKGWLLWQEIEQYLRCIYRQHGYQEVKGPQILDKGLWEKSGHWDKYRENMFITESEKHEFALKPMNCPGHILIFKQGIKSYRDLPLRYGEFGQCHRNEPTGGLHGIMRVRGFTQDDGHIFCTEDQILSEVSDFTRILQKTYQDFGFTKISYKIATRPEQRIGSDEIWDKAEAALISSMIEIGCKYEISAGEGAFYGPKIEYSLRDAIGRQWQCGTIQVDFSMTERLAAHYVGEDGNRRHPVMLHRAIVGSLERFIGILIEECAGAFPLWLAPVQVMIVNITDVQVDYCQKVLEKLKSFGVRSAADLRNEKITYKIREHSLQKIPYLLVIGDKEKDSDSVAVRVRGSQNTEVMTVDVFIQKLLSDIKKRVSI
jgi:threonyl-tRNA synthetase